MGYCKHEWRDRSQVLREVFSFDAERREHDFFVCGRCLKIDEIASAPAAAVLPLPAERAVLAAAKAKKANAA